MDFKLNTCAIHTSGALLLDDCHVNLLLSPLDSTDFLQPRTEFELETTFSDPLGGHSSLMQDDSHNQLDINDSNQCCEIVPPPEENTGHLELLGADEGEQVLTHRQTATQDQENQTDGPSDLSLRNEQPIESNETIEASTMIETRREEDGEDQEEDSEEDEEEDPWKLLDPHAAPPASKLCPFKRGE
jgi:hypothetical protein